MSFLRKIFSGSMDSDADCVMRIEGGHKVWRNAKGKIHRMDGPALEYLDGEKVWYLSGQRHRTDGPAIEYANGDKSWYLNGRLHRTDGPATEYANGDKSWYLNGRLHRTDGPAIEDANGYKAWWLNGQRHRTDGPAIEYANGDKDWYLNHEKLTEQEFNVHPLVLEAQRQKEVEKAASQAEDAARKAEYDRRMRQVIRDFHAKRRGLS